MKALVSWNFIHISLAEANIGDFEELGARPSLSPSTVDSREIFLLILSCFFSILVLNDLLEMVIK